MYIAKTLQLLTLFLSMSILSGPQKQLAQRLGVTQAMVSKLESGDYNYSVEQLWKISQKLGLKLEISLEEKGEEILVWTEEQAEVIEYPGMVVG